MIDTHAHLNFNVFKDQITPIIMRAKERGIKKFIVPSSNLATSLKAVALARKHEEVFASAGLHPIHVAKFSLEDLQQFYTILSSRGVVAVGEIGLDYFYLGKTSTYSRYPNQEEQKKMLVEMLNLASDASLPKIIHCREAHEELLTLLRSEGIKGKSVIHCFSGTKENLKNYLDLDFHVSFAGNITYSNSHDELVKLVPLNRLLLETDCPYLTPVPYRGKKNEPSYLIETAKKIAKLKSISLIELERITDKNAETLFNLKKER